MSIVCVRESRYNKKKRRSHWIFEYENSGNNVFFFSFLVKLNAIQLNEFPGSLDAKIFMGKLSRTII